MKSLNRLFMSCAMVGSMLVLSCGAQEDAAAKDAFANDKQKLGYAIGMQIGQSLQQMEADIDTESLIAAIQDVLGKRELKLTAQEAMEVQQTFFMQMQQKRQAEMQELGAKAEKEGAEFLAKNKAQEGVKVTESGLQYQVITKGEGPTPKETDTVKVHYEGRLLDGTVFDSSYERGEPVEFQLNRVIPGWQEGLQLMQEGAKYKLWIPSELAYGPQGAGQDIPPNATLVFTVELLDVTPQAADGAAGE